MTLDFEIEQIARQEKKLSFNSFDAEIAWLIGNQLRDAARAQGAAIVIDIRLDEQPLFFYAMPGTTPGNCDWVRRKQNVVRQLHRSSYAVGLALKNTNSSLTEKYGYDIRDYAAHGGSFPIVLKGTGCVGSITISGLPQKEDHMLIINVLAEYLEVPKQELSLASIQVRDFK